MKKINLVILLFVLTCRSVNTAIAQDIHFSQFYQTTILNNPALTGIFNEDYKIGATYRNQWSSIGTPFQTSMVDAETKIHVNNANDYVSIGILGYVDKAGTINFQSLGFYPAINYNKAIDDRYDSYISLGLTGGFVNRSVDVSKMTFDNQYVNGSYDPNAGTGEQITNTKLTYWDVGAGITFNSSMDEENNINYFVGLAVYHASSPKTTFYANNANLAMRWDGNFGLNYYLDEEYTIQMYANVMFQNPYREIIAGGLFKWTKPSHSNTPPFALYIGCFYRLQDAIIPTVKIYYKNNTLTFSYDVNNSSLQTVTAGHGGMEISLINSGFWGSYDANHLCPRF